MRNSWWTEEERAALRVLRANGWTCSQIGKRIGKGRSTVSTESRRLELAAPIRERAVKVAPVRKVRPDSLDTPLNEQIRRLWDEGLSTTAIGARLGISKNSVVGKAHRMHLTPRPSPIKPPNPNAPVVRASARRCAAIGERDTGFALPAGHPDTWGLIMAHTPSLQGASYAP